VPLQIHSTQYSKEKGGSDLMSSIRFFFSQFVGIYLTSVFAFVIYIYAKKNNPKLVSSSAVWPSILSGILWSFDEISE